MNPAPIYPRLLLTPALLMSILISAAACSAAELAPGAPSRSLRNGGFEEPARDPAAPPGWGSQGSAFGTARLRGSTDSSQSWTR